ncbi:S8 family serine peptidase [Allorhizocola rhizosphaerae]|uniref:S8 family serine peptidase n=1 Tax=Allorhizocola rhizosphaerae TaxID=1872709 RepID=UPI000E3ED434|nr:S8 family serine peptidase [Allorhizocola rhizosphaerae]
MTLQGVIANAMCLAFVALGHALVIDEVSDGQWFHQYLRTPEAHALSRGNNVKVALLDSGVDADHADLADSVLPGTDLTSTSGGNGRIDSDGHGTAMAGIIAATGRVSGMAPEARVLPVRTTVSTSGAVSALAQGIRWAVANEADVVSISRVVDEDDLLLRQEAEAAIRADVVVVAAVGNRPTHQRVRYPAAISGVMAVAGVDRNGNRSRISVAGPEVDIAAPSDNISSTDKGGGYREGTGTSDAAAIVAGAVALVRARYPNLKAQEVIRRLTATATDRGAPGRDDEYGHGVLNIVAALTAELPGETVSPGVSATARVSASVAVARPEMPGGGRFPWWVLGTIPAAVIVGVIWLRRRRTGRYSTGG